VGGAAQTKAMKKLAGTMRLDLAQYREMAAFSQFASDLDASTRKLLSRGERLTELLKQKQYQPLRVSEQIVGIYAGTKGYLDDIEPKHVTLFEAHLLEIIRGSYPKLLEGIEDRKELTDELESTLKQALESAKNSFNPADMTLGKKRQQATRKAGEDVALTAAKGKAKK
jgi:F-type H+-transporting ATPase subunit alpha